MISLVVSEIVVDLFFAVSLTRNRFRFYFRPSSFCRSLADHAVCQTAENLGKVIFGNMEITTCLRRVQTV